MSGIIRSWQCLNARCKRRFEAWEPNPACPSCKCVRVDWVPGGGHIAGTAKAADAELRALLELDAGAFAGRAAAVVTAAVKALAWCPWQPSLLASGGGSADHHVRFWNAATGACVSSVDVQSQVSGLLWSREHRELVSAHGSNNLSLWKYPSMVKMAEFTGHSARVLHMATSPDGTTVCSAAADETLRFWRAFGDGAEVAKAKAAAKSASGNSVLRSINIR